LVAVLSLLIFSIPHVITKEIDHFSDEMSLKKVQEDFISELTRKIPRNKTIGYWDWWRAPEISFFVDHEFVDLNGLCPLIIFKNKSICPDYVIVTSYLTDIKNLEPFLGSLIIGSYGAGKNSNYYYLLYEYNHNKSLVKARWISYESTILLYSRKRRCQINTSSSYRKP